MTWIRNHSTEIRLKGPAFSALLLVLALGLAAPAWATTYYVATNGNDSWNGLTPAAGTAPSGPFRTLQRTSYAVKPGDTVLIRGGVYQAGSSWVNDGTETAPITISSYNGESVVIDGNGNTLPAGQEGILLQIFGDWNNVSNLEVRYSSSTGVVVSGDHCSVKNVTSHHNRAGGIYMTGWHGLIENCRAYRNSLKNEYAVLPVSWAFGISACRYPQYTTIRGCTSWENWGEGISTFEGQHNTIEDCVSYNNMCNYYVSDSKYTLFQRNLAYCTPGNMAQPYCTQNNILAGDERYNPASSDNIYINNLSLGGERNFSISGGCLNNCLIAHNTFVNGSNTIAPTEAANAYFFAGTASNARVVNNIFVQDTPESSVMICHLETRGILFSNNGWSRLPVTGARATSDVVADPQLLRSGSTAAGELSPDWFRASTTSPAAGRGQFLSQVAEDFAKALRPNPPDMGAYNVSGGTGGDLTASASGMPASGQSPLTVSFIGSAAGGAAPYAFEWAFGDGGTSTSQNPVHIFTSPGRYTATFTVTDGNRSVARAAVGVTVDSWITSTFVAYGTASAMSGPAPLAVDFTGTGSGGTAPYSCSWSFGDGASASGPSVSHTFTAAGTYAVRLTVTDQTAATAAQDMVIHVTPPVASVLSASLAASPTAGPAPLAVRFAGAASGGRAPYTFIWSFGDGTGSAAQNPEHVYAAAGTYAVTLVIRDSRWMTTSKSMRIQAGGTSARKTPVGGSVRKMPSQVLR